MSSCGLARARWQQRASRAEGALALAQAVRLNEHLVALDLGGNQIGDAGAMSLAKALVENKELEELDAASNGIGDAGAHALARAIGISCSALRRIELWGNRVTACGAHALVAAQRANARLVYLGLEHNALDIAARMRLLEKLAINAYDHGKEHRDVCAYGFAVGPVTHGDAAANAHDSDGRRRDRPRARSAGDETVGARRRLLAADAEWRDSLARHGERARGARHGERERGGGETTLRGAYLCHASPWEGLIDAPPALAPSTDPSLPPEFRSGKVAYLHHADPRCVSRGFSLSLRA